jgi:CheY-like chemotaxis protein
MPGKNGYQVCAYVRNHATLSRTPVVLLVGAFDAFDGVAAKQAGATASITKPFEPTALIDLVQSVMSTETETAEPPAPAPARTPPPPVSLVTPAPSPAASRHPLPEGGGGERGPVADPDDLLGLQSIFRQEPQRVAPAMTEDDIDRIADRVIQRLSTQVIESIAWDIVPDITEKIVREEMKRVK